MSTDQLKLLSQLHCRLRAPRRRGLIVAATAATLTLAPLALGSLGVNWLQFDREDHLSQLATTSDLYATLHRHPTRIRNIVGAVKRRVRAIDALVATASYPPGSTSAVRQLYDGRFRQKLANISGGVLGSPFRIPFIVSDVKLKKAGGYEVGGVLPWRGRVPISPRLIASLRALYPRRSLRSAALAGLKTALPGDQISFRTSRLRVLTWKRGQRESIFAIPVEEDIHFHYASPVYLPSIDLQMRLVSLRVPVVRVATALPAPPVPVARFVIFLKGGQTMRASACVLRGSVYDITAYGIATALPKSEILRVTKIKTTTSPPK